MRKCYQNTFASSQLLRNLTEAGSQKCTVRESLENMSKGLFVASKNIVLKCAKLTKSKLTEIKGPFLYLKLDLRYEKEP